MPDDLQTTLYNAQRSAQEKYDYFLLTAAGASVAFAVNQTQGAKLAWSQLPLGAAVLAWGLSFLFGCLRLQYIDATIFANFNLQKIQRGKHPEVGSDPQMIEAAAAGTRQAAETNSDRGRRFARLQFYTFAAGASLFVAWHVWEMYLQK
jgi:hypothetical protein